jgi:DNA-binding LytR/AlgR family response regulator
MNLRKCSLTHSSPVSRISQHIPRILSRSAADTHQMEEERRKIQDLKDLMKFDRFRTLRATKWNRGASLQATASSRVLGFTLTSHSSEFLAERVTLTPDSVERCVTDSIEKFFSSERMREILDEALRAGIRRSKPHRMAIKTKGRILFVDLAEVVAIEARGNYVLLQRQSSSSMLRASISELTRKLEPCGFIRIHRSVLVNSSWIQEIRPWTQREYVVRMREGKEYALSRSYKENLKYIAQFWIGAGAFFAE